MNPRIAGAALAVILLGASCSSASAGEVLESKTARAAPAPAAAAPLGTALDRFGGELFNTVGRSSSLTNANVAISPFSIAAALLMTRAGSSGETRAELDRVLHLLGIDPDAGFNAVDQQLATRSRPGSSTCSPPTTAPGCAWSTTERTRKVRAGPSTVGWPSAPTTRSPN